MRITKLQNEIYKAHVRAWEDSNWTSKNNRMSTDEIKLGKTSKLFWEVLVHQYVSITSQIMISNDTFKHLSGVAQKELRRGFKLALNHYNIK